MLCTSILGTPSNGGAPLQPKYHSCVACCCVALYCGFTQFVERYFSSIAVERHVSTQFVIIWSFYGKGGVYYYWQVIRRGAKTKMALLMLSSEAKAFYLPSPSADAAAMLLMLCSVPIMANKDPPTNRKRLSAYSQAANSAPKTRK